MASSFRKTFEDDVKALLNRDGVTMAVNHQSRSEHEEEIHTLADFQKSGDTIRYKIVMPLRLCENGSNCGFGPSLTMNWCFKSHV